MCDFREVSTRYLFFCSSVTLGQLRFQQFKLFWYEGNRRGATENAAVKASIIAKVSALLSTVVLKLIKHFLSGKMTTFK